MSLSGLLVFAATYLMATASPGPGIAALVARVLARGTAGVPWFIAGFVTGDLAWLCIATAGLAVLAQSFAALFLVIKYAGAAYLLFLAFRLWTAPTSGSGLERPGRPETGPRLYLAGLSVTLGNPKVIAFFFALLPTVVHLETLSLAGFLEIAGLSIVILSSVLAAYALAASRARRLFTSPRSVRALNRGTGAVMAGAAVAVAAR
ncbi:LysE family translocator [Roseomonas sp. KE2513]|uniref:LysE family translocator n=1 Tax=Roseomonas sp. KE2513 TaxID=2479202 RepID=UPI0018DFD438|nr:LysE family translocator [Roseomonas sp. KE2513]MBI0536774.1 LysE family translocator [Roseomonas sp. KE2513]